MNATFQNLYSIKFQAISKKILTVFTISMSTTSRLQNTALLVFQDLKIGYQWQNCVKVSPEIAEWSSS